MTMVCHEGGTRESPACPVGPLGDAGAGAGVGEAGAVGTLA